MCMNLSDEVAAVCETHALQVLATLVSKAQGGKIRVTADEVFAAQKTSAGRYLVAEFDVDNGMTVRLGTAEETKIVHAVMAERGGIHSEGLGLLLQVAERQGPGGSPPPGKTN